MLTSNKGTSAAGMQGPGNKTGKAHELDITEKRLHHEIYLSDARKTAPERMKTVIRHPIKVKG